MVVLTCHIKIQTEVMGDLFDGGTRLDLLHVAVGSRAGTKEVLHAYPVRGYHIHKAVLCVYTYLYGYTPTSMSGFFAAGSRMSFRFYMR